MHRAGQTQGENACVLLASGKDSKLSMRGFVAPSTVVSKSV